MQLGLNALYAFLDTCSTDYLVLATVTRTEGASYRKAGAMMLIDAHFNTSGLVSGGCLEDDLKAHAESVLEHGEPKTIVYDLSQEEAASMWGLGLGCGGQIEVLLERISSVNGYGGLGPVRDAFYSGHACTLRKIVACSSSQSLGAYDVVTAPEINANYNSKTAELNTQKGTTTLSIPVSPVRRLLVCGAGPDAIPLVALAASLSWQVVVADPRPAYLSPEYFPQAYQLLSCAPGEVDSDTLGSVQAAVIMTHNVERDCNWLVTLHKYAIDYIGLLGPTARRDLLLQRAGLSLESRLFGPAGLNIAAVLPEEIALSILAEIHAVLGGRSGTPLSAI